MFEYEERKEYYSTTFEPILSWARFSPNKSRLPVPDITSATSPQTNKSQNQEKEGKYVIRTSQKQQTLSLQFIVREKLAYQGAVKQKVFYGQVVFLSWKKKNEEFWSKTLILALFVALYGKNFADQDGWDAEKSWNSVESGFLCQKCWFFTKSQSFGGEMYP